MMMKMSRDIASVLAPVVASDPHREAVVGSDRVLTYAHLDEEADRAAAALVALGVRPGDRVAVGLPNDTRIVVLFHAAMRLGAVWIGVNRALTTAEQREVVERSGARFALGCADLGLPAVAQVDEDGWAEALAAAPAATDLAPVDPHAPAAIAFTSGTTGEPKGVVHSQHNLLVPGYVLGVARGWGPGLRKADTLPLTILNMLVLTTLLTSQVGGTAVVSDVRDAGRLVAWLRETRPTVWNGVPPMLHDLAADHAGTPGLFESVLEIWSGGDTLSEEVRSAFHAAFGRRVVGTYGLSEAPTIVAIEDPARDHVPGSSGTVLPHLRVVEENGELCVTAADTGAFAGLYRPMLGYWDDPEATAEALQGGVLHTGDLGHVDADGLLFVRDRRKLVVVRGGANVYPAEVERILLSHPDVAAAVVVGVPDRRLGERVGALVQLRPAAVERAVDEAALAAFCRESLARYKVPEVWRLTTEPFGRNAMGKIDRARAQRALGDTP